MKNYRNLNIWQRSHKLTLQVYYYSAEFPKHEIYGLTSQLRRSAVSIPSNIAEGCGRNSDLELARFLVISLGSASELSYQLLLAHDPGYISKGNYDEIDSELIEIMKMLNSFVQKLNPKS